MPAVVALLSWLAISYPQQTAASIEVTLEFIKYHPVASSIGIVVIAAITLGPDILTGTAVIGTVLILAANVGVIQLPSMPSLPKLPGSELISGPWGWATRQFTKELADLDNSSQSRPALTARQAPAALLSKQQDPSVAVSSPSSTLVPKPSGSVGNQNLPAGLRSLSQPEGTSSQKQAAEELADSSTQSGLKQAHTAVQQLKAAGSSIFSRAEQLIPSKEQVQAVEDKVLELKDQTAGLADKAKGALPSHVDMDGMKQQVQRKREQAQELVSKAKRFLPLGGGRVQGGKDSNATGVKSTGDQLSQQQLSTAAPAAKATATSSQGDDSSDRRLTKEKLDAVLANS